MDYSADKRSRAKTRKTFLAGATPLQFERRVDCPYCGESFVFMIDGSAGNQSYYEDCEICCRPILFLTEVDSDGNLVGVTTRREDD
jgi:Cysteine-rich CPXCG